MNVKKMIFSMALVFILMTRIVFGANTCAIDQTTTAAGTSTTYIRGNAVNTSATLTVGDEGINATTAVITVNSPSGVTLTGAIVSNATLSNSTYFNTTINTLPLQDNQTYTLNMTIKNATSQVQIASCTKTFIPDNTVPALSSQSPSDASTDLDGSIDFSVTTTNISSTESGTLYIGDSSYTMSRSGNIHTLTKKLEPGTYTYYYGPFTDGLNTTTDSARTIHISSDASGGSGGGPQFVEAVKTKKETKETMSALGVTSEKAQNVVADTTAWAKEEFTTPKELGKTGIGVVGGAAAGAVIGIWGGPLAIITVPVGAVIGGVLGIIW